MWFRVSGGRLGHQSRTGRPASVLAIRALAVCLSSAIVLFALWWGAVAFVIGDRVPGPLPLWRVFAVPILFLVIPGALAESVLRLPEHFGRPVALDQRDPPRRWALRTAVLCIVAICTAWFLWVL